MASADLVIAAFRDYNPAALELAEVVSFAVRVEPYLLRRMRLELLPDLDAGAEADVWLSPLVQVRSPEGVLFYPEIAAALRGELAENNPLRYFQAWNLMAQLHQHLPAAIQLEEQVAFLSSSLDPDALQQVDLLLQRAAKTLVKSENREGIANWAARALPRFPEKVRELEGAKILVSASYLRLTQHLPMGELNREMPSWMSWILPSGLSETQVRVRLLPEGIELTLGATGSNKIDVPDIKPCVVEITWKTEDGREEIEQLPLQRDEPRLIATRSREFDIRTVQGKRYRLTEKRPMAEQKTRTCFVIMGFGKKTDYRSGRMLDLDKSYRHIIKPAAQEAGYACVRADEIQHSAMIGVPMYEQLLAADVVIADLSTYNESAFYELGVRHALRPYATIMIAEDKLIFPFDVGQIAIRQYHHMGEDIGYEEAGRMRSELAGALKIHGSASETDSPVYTFIADLEPPKRRGGEQEVASSSSPKSEAQTLDQPTVRALIDQVEAALKAQ